jgi:hypothetical protein
MLLADEIIGDDVSGICKIWGGGEVKNVCTVLVARIWGKRSFVRFRRR